MFESPSERRQNAPARSRREVCIEASYKQGDHVIYLRCAVAKIAGREMMEAASEKCECLTLDLPSGAKVFVPLRSAETMLRPLASRAEAETDLEILRQEGVEADNRAQRQRQEDQDRILRSGTRIEVASLLRRLYAKKTPATETQMKAIRTIEGLVLDEIALVLGLSRGDLEAEMRQRHPVFSHRRTHA